MKLDIKFKNPELLREAMTHRSFLNEKAGAGASHNERLEFLGDAVLELCVTEFLFNKFPEKNEGELTSLRAALVNAEMLFTVAKKLKMEKFIRVSRGEAKDCGKGKNFILANAVEALIGALYVDRGYRAAAVFVKNNVCPNLEDILRRKTWIDAKSLFQEKTQEIDSITPTYEVLEESGPDHKKHFVVGVYLGKDLAATGEGFSKQEAQMQAAERALEARGWKV